MQRDTVHVGYQMAAWARGEDSEPVRAAYPGHQATFFLILDAAPETAADWAAAWRRLGERAGQALWGDGVGAESAAAGPAGSAGDQGPELAGEGGRVSPGRPRPAQATAGVVQEIALFWPRASADLASLWHRPARPPYGTAALCREIQRLWEQRISNAAGGGTRSGGGGSSSAGGGCGGCGGSGAGSCGCGSRPAGQSASGYPLALCVAWENAAPATGMLPWLDRQEAAAQARQASLKRAMALLQHRFGLQAVQVAAHLPVSRRERMLRLYRSEDDGTCAQ
ncbi:MAG: hypothetical protein IMW99_02850 [Firmicutes bacterium]|nr:hypothetical protein [Bacillota bacterium]